MDVFVQKYENYPLKYPCYPFISRPLLYDERFGNLLLPHVLKASKTCDFFPLYKQYSLLYMYSLFCPDQGLNHKDLAPWKGLALFRALIIENNKTIKSSSKPFVW